MAANKPVRFGPVALTTTTTTNILNPPTLTGGTGLAGTNTNTFLLLKHIRVVNKTNAAASFALWLGATGANAAGTEAIAGGAATAGALNAGTGVSVQPGVPFDWYAAGIGMRMETADYLVGGAGTATALTIEGEGEIGIE
jgi:hypothetical protein